MLMMTVNQLKISIYLGWIYGVIIFTQRQLLFISTKKNLGQNFNKIDNKVHTVFINKYTHYLCMYSYI